jgi:hypothetical protein
MTRNAAKSTLALALRHRLHGRLQCENKIAEGAAVG